MKLSNMIACIGVATLATTAAMSQTQIKGELGVFKPSANGGINPATGSPWAIGDTYRLAFTTSQNGVQDATSTDISVYNTFVQSVASASTTYPDLKNGTWKVIGATDTVSASANTGTDSAGGVAVILMDGSTIFAVNNADIWNGSPLRYTGVYMCPFYDENGEVIAAGQSVFAGCLSNGTPIDRHLGGSDEVPPRVETGTTTPNRNDRWLRVGSARATSTSALFYALSDPLHVVSGAPAGTQFIVR